MRCNARATSSIASPTGRSVTTPSQRFAGPRPSSRPRPQSRRRPLGGTAPQTAAALGTAEAVAGLGHTLGELALADGDATAAARHFTHALDLLGDLTVPYERAEIELRAAIALAAAGERGLAIERLTTVYRAARRLGARPNRRR